MKILTFDIEEWWIYKAFTIGNENEYIRRLDKYLNDILDLLDYRNLKATFFCLGEIANTHKYVIKLISSRGHHIGCHSNKHQFLTASSISDFAEDTRLALDQLENLIGSKINTYRAPAFSITKKTKWAFEILYENGIEIDCSIFPSSRSYGGFPEYEKALPSIIEYNGMFIKEFPISTSKIFLKNIVYTGGGYFRIIPYSIIERLLKNEKYIMTYFHIKDFDYEQKRIYRALYDSPAWKRYLIDYYGLRNNLNKFKRLVSQYSFINVERANELINWGKAPVIKI